MKKYELTEETKVVSGVTLHRIRALTPFGAVTPGTIGGWIESEKNLSHSGNAWVYGDAMVCDNARVFGNAKVYDNARVFGHTKVYGGAQVFGNAKVFDKAELYGNAWVYGYAQVHGNAEVYGNTWVYGYAQVHGKAKVFDDADVYDNAEVYGIARVYGNAQVYGNADIVNSTHYFVVGPIGSRNGFTTFFRTKDKKIFVSCGCFKDDIQKFEDAVKEKHSGTKHEKTYLAAIELAKLKIEDVSE